MRNIYKLSLCLLFSLVSFSCGKWIDLTPTDRLGEEQLFSSKEGYLKALNGVYVEMANSALYGKEMTAGAVDVLAQYYYVNSSTHSYFQFATFVYTSETTKTRFNAAWSKAYELIANCNVIIEKCGEAPGKVLPQPFYGVIRGEALALRAFLHFDMLRLFGPIYTDANKGKPAIPYVTQTGFNVSPLLSSEEVMQHVTDDLQAALSLLQDVDPVRTEGVRNSANPVGPNDFYYRQYRLNYYAVKALMVRAALWQGKKADAFTQVVDLLSEVQQFDKNVFPYVTSAAATSTDKPDRVFSTEVMFALYDMNRVKMFRELFDVNLSPNVRLSFNGGDTNESRVNALYDDANDYRRRIWQNISSGTVTALTNLKYQDVTDAPGRYMIPLIRLSEMLLIAAECSPDLASGVAWLNKVRLIRNCVSLNPQTPEALKTAITDEFRKEVIGEGQQFFYYKRNAIQTVPNHAALTGTKTMVLTNYVVPLPDSETSQRN